MINLDSYHLYYVISKTFACSKENYKVVFKLFYIKI